MIWNNVVIVRLIIKLNTIAIVKTMNVINVLMFLIKKEIVKY